MIDILKIYLLIGFIVVGIMWAILIWGRKSLFESEKTEDKIAEGLAFFVEVLIWPVEVYFGIDAIIKIRKGNFSEEEAEWYNEGFAQGMEIRKKMLERRQKC